MNRLFIKVSFVLASLIIASQFSACDSGSDDPFRFNGITPSRNEGTGGGTVGSGGSSGRGGSGGVSGTGGSGGTSGSGGLSGASGSSSSGGTSSEGSCNVDFNSTLVLKIEDSGSAPGGPGHNDSPPECCQYAGPRGNSNCPMVYPRGFLNFGTIPGDLFCCGSPGDSDENIPPSELGSGFSTDYVDSLYCPSREHNRHDGRPELAVARWKFTNSGSNHGKMLFRFRMTPGPTPGTYSSCQVTLVRDSFPEARITNSALQGSLVIDAGREYASKPRIPETHNSLNAPEVVGTCEVLRSDGENYQVKITQLDLRFFAQVYNNGAPSNYFRCLLIRSDSPEMQASCNRSARSFTSLLSSDETSPNNYQIIPGFGKDPLHLTTDTSNIPPLNSTQSAMTAHGTHLHFSGGKSTMKIITTLDMTPSAALPVGTLDTNRDDELGTGAIFTLLRGAILTAEIEGEVTKAGTTIPVRTLDDLVSCGSSGAGGSAGSAGSGGTGGGAELPSLSVISNFGTADTLALTTSGTSISTTACATGTRSGSDCASSDSSQLPYAKEGTMDPSVPALIPRFVRLGTVTINNGTTGTVPVRLEIHAGPVSAGSPFRVTSSDQTITLTEGGTTGINIEFSPQLTSSGCTETSGILNCQSDLVLSTSPSVTIHLKGQARRPAGEAKFEEVNWDTSHGALYNSLGVVPPEFSFSSIPTDGGLDTKLFRISNVGVRPLTISNLNVPSGRNFSLSTAIYYGRVIGFSTFSFANSWIIPPNLPEESAQNLFFFLNYEPHGVVATPPRLDTVTFAFNTAASTTVTTTLRGSATNDHSGTLGLYIQDEQRFIAENSGSAGMRPAHRVEGTSHLYRVTNRFFSYRQDPDIRRDVYLFNTARTRDFEPLSIKGISVGRSTPAPDKFQFTPACVPGGSCAPGNLPASCIVPPNMGLPDQAALNASGRAECARLLASGSGMKVGSIVFHPSSAATSHQVFTLPIAIKVMSVSSTGTPSNPLVEGDPVGATRSTLVNFTFKGAEGSPGGLRDLKIHRLMAGFSNSINEGFQRTLIVSTATKGILTRFNGTSPTVPADPERDKDVFILPGGINLNPVTGVATLTKIVTTVDPDMNRPLSVTVGSGFRGLRLFNAPGSVPTRNAPTLPLEYFADCRSTTSSNCAFFYLYIGDWAKSSLPMTCGSLVGDRYAMRQYTDGAPDDVLGREYAPVLTPEARTPEERIQSDCLKGIGTTPAMDRGIVDAQGTYDPVTGHLNFDNLGVRLYAPRVPVISNTVDATLRLSLTTECVTPDKIPDSAIRSHTVPSRPLEDTHYDRRLMPTNPLAPYVNTTARAAERIPCGTNELFGRPLFGASDPTNTLDNEPVPVPDPAPVNVPYTFDIAGIGRNTTSYSSVEAANMYIVIKAEVGQYRCGSGELAMSPPMCRIPEYMCRNGTTVVGTGAMCMPRE